MMAPFQSVPNIKSDLLFGIWEHRYSPLLHQIHSESHLTWITWWWWKRLLCSATKMLDTSQKMSQQARGNESASMRFFSCTHRKICHSTYSPLGICWSVCMLLLGTKNMEPKKVKRKNSSWLVWQSQGNSRRKESSSATS